MVVELIYSTHSFRHILGVRGTKVIQQIIPFRKTTVRMKFTKASVTIVTSNVIRLRLTEPAISPVFWTKKRVIVDGVEVSLDKKNGMIQRRFQTISLFILCDLPVPGLGKFYIVQSLYIENNSMRFLLEDNMFEICKEGTRNWKSCEDAAVNFESETQRGPLNLGPARRIAERPFLIVVGRFGLKWCAQDSRWMTWQQTVSYHLTFCNVHIPLS